MRRRPPPAPGAGTEAVIPLLRELDAAARTAALPDDPEHARALRLLGWERVAGQVAARARTRRGGETLRTRRPFVEAAPIALRHRLQDQVRAAVEADDAPPLSDPSDALDLLERPRPWRLSGEELLHLAVTAADLDACRGWCLRRAENAPDWAAAAGALPPLDAVHGRILAMLDRDGCVKDDATPRLRALRRTERDRERQARDAVARAMDHARAKGWTNGPEVTLRGDRFCLPLQAGARRRLDGIVHDRSATGGTVYVEPAEVVQLQNDLVEARLDAAAEVERILLELNALVEARAGDLETAAALLLLLDETQAAVRWSRDVGGVRPELAAGARPELHGLRHPLLLARLGDGDADAVVPLDLDWPADARALVVSGPNAGGKSVALKGVGVAVLLAQCGWDVPARPGTRLPLIRRLCVDLGDDQSISRSLSSFSAHLDHLGRFLDLAGPDALILCDEIGSGTDPEEGSVLAFTMLEALIERGALVLASTHYGLLKAAVDDHPAMANAAMDFDEADLRPLFTLRLGVPGASHAFAIAARLGLPADLLARARSRVGEERFRVENLLAELGTRTRRLAETEAELERRTREAAERSRALEARLAGLEQEKRAVLERVRREGEAFLAEARRTLEGVVREIRSGGAEKEIIKAGRKRLNEVAGRLPAAPATPPVAPLAVGDQVRVPHLGWTGRVMEVRGDRLVVDAHGSRLTLGRGAVEPLPGRPAAAPPRPFAAGAWRWRGADGPVDQELDLRGYRADEGWEVLDRLLDRAIPAGTREIRVIHGHGTGRLKAHLRRRLAEDARVAQVRDAAPDRGGDGCSVVLLADI